MKRSMMFIISVVLALSMMLSACQKATEVPATEVLPTPKEIEKQVQRVRDWWADPQVNPLGHNRLIPPLFVSEYNISWATSIRRQLGSQVGALWNAEVIGRMANVGLPMAAHFALQGTTWQGLVGMMEDPRPVYWVYRMYNDWGDQQVKVISPDDDFLPAFASRRQDGSLAIMVINKHKFSPRSMTLRLNGFKPAGDTQVWSLEDGSPLVEKKPLKIRNTFDYEFPAFSITYFIIPTIRTNNMVWIAMTILFLLFVVFAALARWRKIG